MVFIEQGKALYTYTVINLPSLRFISCVTGDVLCFIRSLRVSAKPRAVPPIPAPAAAAALSPITATTGRAILYYVSPDADFQHT